MKQQITLPGQAEFLQFVRDFGTNAF